MFATICFILNKNKTKNVLLKKQKTQAEIWLEQDLANMLDGLEKSKFYGKSSFDLRIDSWFSNDEDMLYNRALRLMKELRKKGIYCKRLVCEFECTIGVVGFVNN